MWKIDRLPRSAVRSEEICTSVELFVVPLQSNLGYGLERRRCFVQCTNEHVQHFSHKHINVIIYSSYINLGYSYNGIKWTVCNRTVSPYHCSNCKFALSLLFALQNELKLSKMYEFVLMDISNENIFNDDCICQLNVNIFWTC